MVDIITRRNVMLTRDLKQSGPLGTFGQLDTGTFKCPTLERPPSGDHACISAGSYDVDFTDAHPHHNPCYEIMNVPGRTAILIHPANWFQELLGCIAPGTAVGIVEGKLPDGTPIKQKGVSGSRSALDALLNDLKREPFHLVIKES